MHVQSILDLRLASDAFALPGLFSRNLCKFVANGNTGRLVYDDIVKLTFDPRPSIQVAGYDLDMNNGVVFIPLISRFT